MNHFENFLKGCLHLGQTQVKLVPRINEHGKVEFYAVGQCGPASGDTFNGVVEGKHVRWLDDEPAEEEEGEDDLLTELERRADEEAENARGVTGLAEGDLGEDVPAPKKGKKAKS